MPLAFRARQIDGGQMKRARLANAPSEFFGGYGVVAVVTLVLSMSEQTHRHGADEEKRKPGSEVTDFRCNHFRPPLVVGGGRLSGKIRAVRKQFRGCAAAWFFARLNFDLQALESASGIRCGQKSGSATIRSLIDPIADRSQGLWTFGGPRLWFSHRNGSPACRRFCGRAGSATRPVRPRVESSPSARD